MTSKSVKPGVDRLSCCSLTRHMGGHTCPICIVRIDSDATPGHTVQPVAEIPGYAFRLGFAFGERTGPASPNDAEAILGVSAPYDEITAFCCGSEDGAVGDRWRLDRLGAPWHANPLFSR